MRTTTAWQSTDHSTALRRVTITRRDPRPDDVVVRIDYCGVCHSDLHAIHGAIAGKSADGLVPGHEFTGVVVGTGTAVTRFTPGDRVAVGTCVGSCGVCTLCLAGQENYCLEGPTSTYGGTDRIDGTTTQGGYSREYVLPERFAYLLPDALDPAAAAPLLCAGITVWEPLRAAGIGPGSTVAVVGLGGLGHLGVKLAVALGAEVTVLSRTPGKADDARALGATALLTEASGYYDLILDTVPGPHEVNGLLGLLTLGGALSVVGYPRPVEVNILNLTLGRKNLSSSGTGGTKHTAELLAFCAEKGITADVEVLPSARVEEALTRLEKGDVRYRFVLDLADLG